MTRFTVRVAAVAMALTVAFGASACSGGKPSKDELRSAFEKAVGPRATEGEQKEQQDKTMDCLVDQVHDKVSTEGLKKLIESANRGDKSADLDALSEEDQKAMDEVAKECAPLKN